MSMITQGGSLHPRRVGNARRHRAPADEGPGPKPCDAEPAQPPRILIVEDEWFIASEVETILQEAGYAVIGVAATAEDAVKLAGSGRPDLVLMDIRLSGRRDGIAAAIEINTKFGIRSLYVTAHTDPHPRHRGEAANPLGWLSKPILGDELVAAVGAAVARLA